MGAAVTGADGAAPPVVTLAVIDHHPLFRSAVAAVFEGVPDVAVVLACRSVEDFEAQLERAPDVPRVVLLDPALPGTAGADAVRRVTRRGPDVLVLAGSAVPGQVVDVVASGARGYLVKTARAEDVVQAVRAVAAGSGCFPPEVAAVLGPAIRDRGPRLPEITPREREVLRLVAAGLTDRMIAHRLTISLATVRSHLERIRGKTGSRRRADLTRIALRAGLTDVGAS